MIKIMIEVAQYYSDVPSHDLPRVDAHLCVPGGKPNEAYIKEKTVWAGEVNTPFPIEVVDVDNRGESYRCFAVAISGGRLFPISLYDVVDLIGFPVFSPELMDTLLRKGLLTK